MTALYVKHGHAGADAVPFSGITIFNANLLSNYQLSTINYQLSTILVIHTVPQSVWQIRERAALISLDDCALYINNCG